MPKIRMFYPDAIFSTVQTLSGSIYIAKQLIQQIRKWKPTHPREARPLFARSTVASPRALPQARDPVALGTRIDTRRTVRREGWWR